MKKTAVLLVSYCQHFTKQKFLPGLSSKGKAPATRDMSHKLAAKEDQQLDERIRDGGC